eukprot:TRINITY_DN1776_c0_g1_i1.p1 TRINITY_DN1776_c0_g1~~TRINITY_DN1776_c0_g1_i1.p1  ORF type:complete len:112 (+),score=16.51 TRINITY_DN1776_c0_g1_i1:91-426(+)
MNVNDLDQPKKPLSERDQFYVTKIYQRLALSGISSLGLSLGILRLYWKTFLPLTPFARVTKTGSWFIIPTLSVSLTWYYVLTNGLNVIMADKDSELGASLIDTFKKTKRMD